MFNLQAYLSGGVVLVILAVLAWLVSVYKKDVSIVDNLWPVKFILLTVIYLFTIDEIGPRAQVVASLVFIWAIRLAVHITWRNWGEGEDRRYQAIRHNNEPNFTVKSLYIIFLFQAVLAWIISLPILAALTTSHPVGALDYFGTAIVVFGIVFESTADYQLQHFKSNPDNHGQVMDRGLWRFTRHPNYFGECSVWWGLFLLAISGGAWWSILSPLLMTFLLLKFSGVALLEKDISQRRPAYQDYIRRTNAFIPWRPRNISATETEKQVMR